MCIRDREVPLPAAKELEKGLAEFSQWEDVLESLSVSNPALRGALNGSKAYRKGTDLMPVSYTHLDVYKRQEYFFGDGVCLVEWAQLVPELIPEDAVHILIEKAPEKGFDYRRVRIGGKEEMRT